MIRARGISQRFGHHAALDPLDIELAAGERLAVLGPNGAGKTSLLRILATAARPASGTLEIDGLDALGRRSEVRRRLGYLAHQPALYPSLTALENVEFFARLHGLAREAAAAALRRCGIAALAGRPVSELSRGLTQRVALARTIVHGPAVLILDEPDASLDADGRALLAELVAGSTVVLATHDAELAMRLCRRTLPLRDGHVERARPAAAAR